jgi:hypothetical protein
MGTTITRRRLDYLLLPCFLVSIVYSLLFSLPEALGVPVTEDSAWPPLRSLYTWSVEQEPQHLVMPPTLQATVLYDGFVQSALLIVLAVGLWRLAPWPWLPTVALAYAVGGVLNMYFYFMQTFLGPHPPPHLGTYLPLNVPWAILPLLVGYRFLRLAVGEGAGRS